MQPEYRSWETMNQKRVVLSQPDSEDDSYLLDTGMTEAMLHDTITTIAQLIISMRDIPSLEKEVHQLGVFATKLVLGDSPEETANKESEIDT